MAGSGIFHSSYPRVVNWWFYSPLTQTSNPSAHTRGDSPRFWVTKTLITQVTLSPFVLQGTFWFEWRLSIITALYSEEHSFWVFTVITACCSAGTGTPGPAPARRLWPAWSPGTGHCWRLSPPGNICSWPSSHRRPRCPWGSCPPSSLSSRAQSRSAGGNWPRGWGRSPCASPHTSTRHKVSSGGNAAPQSASLTSPTRWCSGVSLGFPCSSLLWSQRFPAILTLWKVHSSPVLLSARRGDQRATLWILG